MDVQCEKCKAEYSLDDTLVGSAGTSVRCTECGHVFKAYFPASGKNSSVRWRLRQVNGATFPLDNLSKLQTWITEGKVTRNDKISKQGGEWKRLGDFVEMQQFFDKAERKKASSRDVSPISAGFQGVPANSMRLKKTIGSIPPPREETAGYPKVSDPAKSIPIITPVANQRSTNPPPPMAKIKQQTTARRASSAQKAKAGRKVKSTIVGSAPIHKNNMQPRDNHGASSKVKVDSVPSKPSVSPPPKPSVNPPPKSSVNPLPKQDVQTMDTLMSGATIRAIDNAPLATAQTIRKIDVTEDDRVRASEKDLDVSQIPGLKDEQWEAEERDDEIVQKIQEDVAAQKTPAWAEKKQDISRSVEDVFEQTRPAEKVKIGRWIFLFVFIGLVGCSFYLYFYKPTLVRTLTAQLLDIEKKEDNRFNSFYLKGKESFLLDTVSSFTQADREFHTALALKEEHVPIMVALGELYAVWAQQLLDQELDALEDAKMMATESVPANLKEANRLHAEFEAKLTTAKQWIDKALAKDPTDLSAVLVLADIKRLEGNLSDAKIKLAKGKGSGNVSEAAYLSALIGVSENKSTDEIVGMLKAVSISNQPLLRSIYRQARVLASAQKKEEASGALKELFQLNSSHEMGRTLQARLDAGKVVRLTKAVVDPKEEQPALEGETQLAQATEPSSPQVDAESGTENKASVEPKDEAAKELPAGEAGEKSVTTAAAPVGGSVDNMLNRAGRHQENNQTGQAMALYKEVLRQRPNNIEALSGIAYCYSDKGNKGQAISHFRRALQQNGAYGPAIIGLANTYKSMGQTSEANKWYQKYLDIRPSGRYAGLAKRNLAQMKKDKAESEPAEKKQITIRPKDTSSVTEGPSDEAPKTIIVPPKEVEITPKKTIIKMKDPEDPSNPI